MQLESEEFPSPENVLIFRAVSYQNQQRVLYPCHQIILHEDALILIRESVVITPYILAHFDKCILLTSSLSRE